MKPAYFAVGLLSFLSVVVIGYQSKTFPSRTPAVLHDALKDLSLESVDVKQAGKLDDSQSKTPAVKGTAIQKSIDGVQIKTHQDLGYPVELILGYGDKTSPLEIIAAPGERVPLYIVAHDLDMAEVFPLSYLTWTSKEGTLMLDNPVFQSEETFFRRAKFGGHSDTAFIGHFMGDIKVPMKAKDGEVVISAFGGVATAKLRVARYGLRAGFGKKNISVPSVVNFYVDSDRFNLDKNKQDVIGDGSQGVTLSFSTSKGKLAKYRLTENMVNNASFMGQILLNAHATHGDGPDRGVLAAEDNDTLVLTIDYGEAKPMVVSVPIRR